MNNKEKNIIKHLKKPFILLLVLTLVLTISYVNGVNAKTKWKLISKDKVQGVWGQTDVIDDENHDNIITFYKNGKIEFRTWRTYCKGTYKIDKRKRKILAIYTKNTFSGPIMAENPTGIVEYGKCKVVYRLKTKNKIKAEIKTHNSLMNGGLYTKKGTSTFKDGEYWSVGYEMDDDYQITKQYKMKIKNHKLILTGSLQYNDSDSDYRSYAPQERSWDIYSKCIFGYSYISAKSKNESSDNCNYKKIIQVSNKGMNGNYSTASFTIRNGEIIKLHLLYAESNKNN